VSAYAKHYGKPHHSSRPINALPTLAVLAIIAEHEDNPLLMGTRAMTALPGIVSIIAGEVERHVRAIAWIAIAVVASIVCAALESLTGNLSGSAMTSCSSWSLGCCWVGFETQIAILINSG
jgi:hypothetical protein